MGTRITNTMMHDTIRFNLSRSIARFLDTQTQLSTGRRINKASDDPVGTVRDLDYRNELAHVAQHQRTIETALTWNNTYDSLMADVSDFLSSSKEIAVAMADGTYDEVARQASSNEIQSVLDRLIQIGNSELEGRRIFGGASTRTKPFELGPNGVIYRGDQGKIEFEIDSSLRMAINSNGSDLLLKPFGPIGAESDLNIAVTGTTLLADLKAGTGIDLTPGTFTITDRNRNLSATVDISTAVTVNDAITQINTAITAAGITGLTVALGGDKNNLAFDVIPNGLLSSATLVGQLNDGRGIDLSNGTFKISNGSTVDVTIDLSGSQTVSDVVTKVNTQLATAGVANVAFAINAAGTGFEIRDTNGVPLGLTVSDVAQNSKLAADLGIIGNVGALLSGEPLNTKPLFEISETTGTTASDLGIIGSFNADKSGNDLNPRLLATSLVSDFRNSRGIDRGEIVIWQGERSLTIDLTDPTIVNVQNLLDRINTSGLAITASINAGSTGVQIVNNDPNRSLTIEDGTDSRAAKEMGLFGSSDLMGTMIVLNNALKRNDQEGTGMLLKEIDQSILHVLGERSTVGSRGIRLETTASRHDQKELTYTERLSEVEDADLTTLITQLSAYENNYQAALNAAAKIIQPSLLDFLR